MFDDALRTQIDTLAACQAQFVPGFEITGDVRAQVIGRQGCQRIEAFRIVRLGAVGLDQDAGEEIIHVRDAGGIGMPPGHALHRRQASKGQEIGAHVHADIGVKQNIQLLRGDGGAGLGQIGGD